MMQPDDILGAANVAGLGDLVCREREIDLRLRRFIEFAHTTVVLTISVTHEIMRRALYLEELLRSHEHTRALKMIPVGKWFDEPIDA